MRHLLAASLPLYSFPREAAIHVNGSVLLFAVVCALLTGLLFGSSPAWQLSRPDVGALIQSSGVRLAGNLRNRNLHRMLIAGQVALTMLMLAGAGAAIQAFLHLYHTPLGFDPGHLFYMAIGAPKESAPNWQHLAVSQESIRQTAESTPGVVSASVTDNWIPPFSGYVTKVFISSNPNLTDAQASLALVNSNMFSTLRMPLLSGRFFTPQEDARAAHVALVNRAFVKQFVPGGSVIGQSVRSPGLKMDIPDTASTANPDGWLQIVGVVDDARNDGLDRPVRPAVYLPDTFILDPHTTLVVRSQGDPGAAMRAIGTSLHRLNPDLIIQDEHDFEYLLTTQAWGRERFLAGPVRALRGPGAYALRGRRLQRRVVHRIATHPRIRRARGPRRAARRADPFGVAVVFADCGRGRVGWTCTQPCAKQAARDLAARRGAGPNHVAGRVGAIAVGHRTGLHLSGLARRLHQPDAGDPHRLA